MSAGTAGFMWRQWHSLFSFYPSFFSLSASSPSPFLPPPPDLVASSSFKNHFTLGKTQQPTDAFECVLNGWDQYALLCCIIHDRTGDLRAALPPVACESGFILGQLGRRHSALYSHSHPSHGRPVSRAAVGVDIFLHRAGFPTSKPRSEGWEGQGDTHTHRSLRGKRTSLK